MRKQRVFIPVLFLLALLDICLYWNIHQYYRAKERLAEPEERIMVLEKAKKFNPFNDLVDYELGKAYFARGMDNLADVTLRDLSFRLAFDYYSRSLRLNPASVFAHFDFAQSLAYMTTFDLPYDVDPYQEYRRAARLTGHNTQVFYEVGKILFSRWPTLTESDKDFTLEMLHRVLEKGNKEKLLLLLQIWDFSVRDYRILERILPRSPEVYRLLAQFLGEKTLSLDERRQKLAEAESLEFEEAKDEFSRGEQELHFYRTKKAWDHFQACLALLGRIRFYQDLAKQTLIDKTEFDAVKKMAYLGLAKCRLEETGNIEDAKEWLLTYIEAEGNQGAIGELASYLKVRGGIGDKVGTRPEELGRFSFQLLLNFKQNRFRDITKASELLSRSFLVIPDAFRQDYLRLLTLIGDSFQKLDYIYESNNYYQKALELDRGNLRLLLRLRKNYERLNDDQNRRAVEEASGKLLSPREMVFRSRVLVKGRTESFPLILDGKVIKLELSLKSDRPEASSLVSVFFNERVVWEGIIGPDPVRVEVQASVGENTLMLMPVSRDVILEKISYSSSEEPPRSGR